jgi:two-component system, NtrC family, sensor histidine kinase PilS
MAATNRAFDPSVRVPRSDERLERHLIILMAARLALASASLLIGLALDLLGGNLTVQEWHGFYVTVALAFVATLVYRPFVGRIKRPRLFAAVNIATDIGLVSALVLFSGARESVFTFLYVMVVIYSATLFQRRGALACAFLAGGAYGAVLLAGQWGWFVPAVEAEHPGMLATSWGVHAGALVLVAMLATFLMAELERTGTALHERTSALVELQTLHERTVESLMSGLLTTDPQGTVTSFNREAERISGISREEALGMDVEVILPGVRAMLHSKHEEEHRGRARMQYENARREQLFLGVGAYVLRDGRGASSGHVVIFQDVSEVVQMERELRRSERLAAAGQLSASIAHEIRNPLAAISGSIQVLRDYVDEETGESKRLMEIVDREVDRLNHLITDFLQFARPGPSRREAIEIADVVSDVMQMFDSIEPPDVRVEIEIEPGLAVQADAGQLRQVLWNLVLNAAQAMPNGGVLRVCARHREEGEPQERHSDGRSKGAEPAGWAEISVMDQGVGISPEVMDRIFDPFFTTRAGGSGLGLATVHRIVADHGGFVRLENKVERWSTIVRVRLPRPEPA